jgi:hypothetical protein
MYLKGDDGEGTAEKEAVKNFEKAIKFARSAGSFARVSCFYFLCEIPINFIYF